MTHRIYIIVLCGAPGSGKTTWAKKQHLPLINIDLKRKKILGTWAINPSSEVKRKAYDLAVQHALRLIQKKTSFIWDATGLKKDRLMLLRSLRGKGVHFIAVHMTTPLSECLRRNMGRSGRIDESIIEERFRNLKAEPATAAEGFNEVIHI